MNVALRTPGMTREQFFAWAAAQDGRYEFDGQQPVAMTGGTLNHDQIGQNVIAALRARLQGSACRVRGPNAGVATVGNTVRYPDAVVSCTQAAGTASLVPAPVVVFEVLSPTSGRIDWITKVTEYRAVETIRRYLILEYASVGLTVLERANGRDDWTAATLLGGDVLPLPEVGIELPVIELYAYTDLPRPEDAAP